MITPWIVFLVLKKPNIMDGVGWFFILWIAAYSDVQILVAIIKAIGGCYA